MFGLTMLVPWALSWAMHDGAESAFDEAVLLTVGTGLGLWYVTRKEKRDLTIRDGFLMVALVWTVLAGLCRTASGDPAQCEFYRCLF
jgi:trk system potassium uptake protein TrkH